MMPVIALSAAAVGLAALGAVDASEMAIVGAILVGFFSL